MAATFTRVNSVIVDPLLTRTRDAYVDPSFSVGGAFAANLASEMNPTASTGAAFRGMPLALASGTGKIVPINVASTAAAKYCGVAIEDITAYVSAKGTKIAFATSGRVRSYAGGALNLSDPVKADTSAAFSGFVKWVSGTDGDDLRLGHVAFINDGSDGNAPAVSAAQGDTIFVDLI